MAARLGWNAKQLHELDLQGPPDLDIDDPIAPDLQCVIKSGGVSSCVRRGGHPRFGTCRHVGISLDI